jgi:hypothetical protein
MHRWFHNGIMYSLESNYHYTTFDLLKLPTSGDIKNLVHDIRSAKQKFKCGLVYYHMQDYIRAFLFLGK